MYWSDSKSCGVVWLILQFDHYLFSITLLQFKSLYNQSLDTYAFGLGKIVLGFEKKVPFQNAVYLCDGFRCHMILQK